MDFRLSRIVVYPIKSLDGLALDAAQVMPTGALANDRRYAMRSAQGAWISGKTNPGVHPLRAAFDQDVRRVRLLSEMDGRQGEFSLSGDLAPLNAWLSDYFEEPVMVVENRRAGFPDDTDSPGPTILARQTLEEVHTWFTTLTVDELRRRFRANLEFEGDAPFCEDRLVADGRHVVRFAIGEVVFEGVTACQRCIVPTRDSHTAVIYPRFARQFAEHRAATLPSWTVTDRFDHYYRLTVNTRLSPLSAAGEIHLGDEVRILDVVPA